MIRNVAIVSLSSGITGEESVRYEVEIGLRRLKEYGLNVKFMPHALKGLEYVRDHPEKRAEDLLEAFRQKFPNVQVDLAGIVNHFFGETITVSGLITGQDLIAQLKGRDLGSEVLITINMLRNGENVLLDDLTTDDVEEALGTRLRVTGSSGGELLAALLGEESHLTSFRSYPEWEKA